MFTIKDRMQFEIYARWGNDCCSVGRDVASHAQGLRLESSHRQILYRLSVNCCEKDKLKEAGNCTFFKKMPATGTKR